MGTGGLNWYCDGAVEATCVFIGNLRVCFVGVLGELFLDFDV